MQLQILVSSAQSVQSQYYIKSFNYKFYKTYFSEYLQDGGRFILGQSGQEAKNVHMDSFTAPTSARLSLSWVDM